MNVDCLKLDLLTFRAQFDSTDRADMIRESICLSIAGISSWIPERESLPGLHVLVIIDLPMLLGEFPKIFHMDGLR